MREPKNQSTCILVVDNDEDICLTLTDQLLAMGYEVYQATNGREALDTFSRKTIDGMLVDIQMPVMDGRCWHNSISDMRISPSLSCPRTILGQLNQKPENMERKAIFPSPLISLMCKRPVFGCLESFPPIHVGITVRLNKQAFSPKLHDESNHLQ